MSRPLRSVFLAALSLGIASAACAQTPPASGPQSFDQYPSFIELTSTMPDSTKIVLRCGYAAPNGQVVADAGYEEVSLLNQDKNIYSRFQQVDNNMIATYATNGSESLLVELLAPDNSISAKNCKTNLSNDTIGDCLTAAPKIPSAPIRDEQQKMNQQCQTLIQQNIAQIKPTTASPEKTAAFKATLHEKIQVLAAP